jgi:hypothetical protein
MASLSKKPMGMRARNSEKPVEPEGTCSRLADPKRMEASAPHGPFLRSQRRLLHVGEPKVSEAANGLNGWGGRLRSDDA